MNGKERKNMKNEKWWMGLLTVVVMAGAAVADEITLQQAETAVGNWIARGGAFGKLASQAEMAGETFTDPDTGAKMHMVRVPGKGFVVTSADDGIEPIILFSDEDGEFVAGEGNPLWNLLRLDLAAREKAMEARAGESFQTSLRRGNGAGENGGTSREKWAELLGGGRRPRAAGVLDVSDMRVAPLLATKWGQGTAGGQACWNYYTPNQYVCGCNATALAQIMRHWQKPSGSVSAKSYTCKVDGTSRKMTMKGGTYNWAQMPANPSGGATAAQCEAMGKLAYDAAVSLATIWTGSSGVSCLLEMMPALKSDFGYSSAVALEYASGYYNWSLEEFKKAVIPNLDKKCPVAVGMTGGGNHTAVADGYGYSGGAFYIHLNFGWNGIGDAWYSPPEVRDFTAINHVLCNVFPAETGNILSGRVTDSRGVPVSGATVKLMQGSATLGTAATDGRGIYMFTTTRTGSFTVTATYGGMTASRQGALGNTKEVEMESERSGAGYHYMTRCAIGNTYGNDLQFSGTVSGTSSVTLNAQGGSGGTAAVTATYGSSMPAIAVPTRTGYVFGGYWTGPDGTGLQCYTAAGTSVGTWDQTGETTLYAKWTYTGSLGTALDNTALSFTTEGPFPWVSQSSDTHDGSDAARCAAAGSGGANWSWTDSAIRTTLPGSGRLSFWWKAILSGGGSMTFTGDDFYEDTENPSWTLFSMDFCENTAHDVKWTLGCNGVYGITGCVDQVTWTPGYAVVLDGGGSWEHPTTVLGVPGEPLPDLPVEANRPFYAAYRQFAGFYSGTNGTGTQYYNALGKCVRNWDIAANTTLYAKWNPATYAITLDRQGGSGGAAGTTATYGNSLPTIAPPTRTGYDFIGYFSETGGNGTQYYYADGRGCQSWITITHTTLYAHWAKRDTVVWGYRIEDGEAIVTNAVPAAGRLEIPSELGGYPVTAIGPEAFEDCTNLVGVSIPEGVTSIGYSAFSSCRYLVSLSLPGTLTGIGIGAFWGCDGLTSVTIPDGMTEIPASAFACRGLTSVTIGSGVTSFGERAFANTQLTSVDIPDQVESIDPLAFYASPDLTEIRVGSSNSHYASENGVLFSKDKKTLVCMPGGKTGRYEVPSGVEIIGSHSFASSPLREIVFSDTLGRIEDYAFDGCKLEAVSIPDSVSHIGAYAFDSASSLVSVWIGRGVMEIGKGAFKWCPSLEWFQVDDANPAYESDGGVLFTKGKREIVRVPPEKAGNYAVAEGVEIIGHYAFYLCKGLTSVSLPDSVTSIGEYAFDDCAGLMELTIPAGVTNIGRYAFESCSGLGTIAIPDRVTILAPDLFAYCTNLTTATIPDSVMEIGSWAFGGCARLTSLRIPPYVTNVSYQVFNGCGKLTTLQVPEEWAGTDMLANAAVPAGCTVTTYPTRMQRVTFDAGSGECDVPFLDFERGGTYGEFPEAEWTNHVFLGWFTTADGGSPVTSGMAVSDDLVRRVHAHWSQPISTITFDQQGGTGGTSSVRVMYGEKLPSVEIPARGGYDFGGYYEGPDGTGTQYYNAAGKGTATWNSKRNTTLYARWHEKAEVTWSYRIENGKAVVTGATPATGRVEIPAMLGGYPVKSIGRGAFAQATNLTEIVIPAGVTEIESLSFYECWDLVSVTIPPGVTSIGSQAFEYCFELSSVDIPVGVTNIDASAFSYCSQLSSVSIPSSVTSMGDCLFGGCTSLEEIRVDAGNPCFSSQDGVLFSKTILLCVPGGRRGEYDIPSSVTDIAPGAFQWCSRLTAVTIPDSVGCIGYGAFTYCRRLQSIKIPEGVENIDNIVFYGCNSLESVTIPSSVTNISVNAFAFCDSLSSVILPSRLRSIEGNAFQYCDTLSVVSVPDGVERLEYGCFANCTNLSGVALGEGVRVIGDSAFFGCRNLSSLRIPPYVTNVAAKAFAECTKLATLYVPEEWAGTDMLGRANVPAGCQVVTYPTQMQRVVFDADGGTCAEFWADFRRGETYGDFPTPERANHSFEGWFTATIGGEPVSAGMPVSDVLVRVLHAHWSLPVSTVTFDRQGGTGGTASVNVTRGDILPAVEIPTRPGHDFGGYFGGLDGTGTQYYNAAGRGMQMWNSASNATLFAHWIEKNEVVWGYRIEDGKAIVTNASPARGQLIFPSELGGCPVGGIGYRAFLGATNLTTVIIPDSVTSIEGYAFGRCGNLVSVSMPESLTAIGQSAFFDCTNLVVAHLPDNLTRIEQDAFYGCGMLEDLVLPRGLVSIGKVAFYGCTQLETVTVPASVTSVGDGAFANCIHLDAIQVAAGNTAFESEDGVLFTKGKRCLVCAPGKIIGGYAIPDDVGRIADYAFSHCMGLLSVDIPGSVTNIGICAFEYCDGLTSMSIPPRVAEIKTGTFQSCRGLTSVDIPGSVTNIGYYAFEGAGLESLVVPGSVKSIGGYAFSGCKLKDVTLSEGVATISSGAFHYCKFTTLSLPDSMVSLGAYVFFLASLNHLEVPASWWGTDKLANVSLPGGTEVVYRGIEPLVVSTKEVLPGTPEYPYEANLEAAGGVAPYTWHAVEVAYTETGTAGSHAKTGTAQGWNADDGCWNLALPFAFPFFGRSCVNAKINSNGTISFGTDVFTARSYSAATFRETPLIAVLWKDLSTVGGDIYVETGSDWATVRWLGKYGAGGAVNFSATLHKNGKIVLAYGEGNESGGIIGISAGDGATWMLSAKSGNGSMSNAEDIVFHPATGLPEWLELTSDGWLRGTPEANGEFAFGVEVMDSAGVTARGGVVLAVQPLVSQRVTFDANGGDCPVGTKEYGIPGTYGSLPTATWSWHAFLGWFTKASGGTKVTTASAVTMAATRTLFAHWTTNQMTTFQGNGGTPTEQVRTNTMGKAYGTLPDVTWANHAFLGWYTTAAGGTRIATNSMVSVAKDRTLYAHWTTNQVTTFKGNGGTPATLKTTNTIGKTYGTFPAVTWSNHVFMGWYTATNGGTRVLTRYDVTAEATRMLYARWTDKQTTVFQGNGGTPAEQVRTNTMGKAYGTFPDVTWANHSFLGWFTAAEGGTRILTNSTVTVAKERTLWAHWREGAKSLSILGMCMEPRYSMARMAGRSNAEVIVLRFEAEAGGIYEVQWTEMLGGEWETILSWQAEADGVAELEVPMRAGEAGAGFYRVATDE